MSNIIIDLKKKKFRYGWDEQFNDVLGVEHAKKEKARTIDIPNESRNPVHEVMRTMGVKSLLGRRAFCFNSKKEVVSGVIADVIPPYFLHLRNKGVFKIDDCISIGG